MTIKTLDKYRISLDLKASNQTKETIAKLKDAFADESKSIDELSKEYQRLIKDQKEHTQEAKAYNSLLQGRLNALEKENNLLIHSTSEIGKAQRERLQSLKAIQKERKLTKDEEKELKSLQKSVLDMSDEELAKRKREVLELRTAIKYEKTRLSTSGKELSLRQKIANFAKGEAKAIWDKVKAQTAYLKSLKTTEGRMNAAKKVVGTAAKMGIGASAIIGGALAGADNAAIKEREARRIKVSGLSDDEKQAIVGELSIQTGKDAGAIVDAINRATNAVKTSNPAQIKQMALAELEFPGTAALFQSSSGASSDDFTIFQNRLRAIQRATGMGSDDMASIMDSVSNLGDSAFKAGITQQDLVGLYSALQGSNVFDSQEQMERAIRGFLAQKDINSGNFYDKMGEFDWSKYVTRTQNRNQADAFRQNFDFAALKQAANSEESTTLKKTSAEKAAESARRIAAKKDELVQRILERLDASGILDNGMIEKVIEMLFKTLDAVLPLLDPLFKVLDPVLNVLNTILSAIQPVIGKLVELIKNPKKAIFSDDEKQPASVVAATAAATKAQNSQGGIVLSPSIVGERGAELVLPLGFDRKGRSSNIIQNVQQTFNMGGNRTTAMSLGQAVRQRSFTDNLFSSRMYGE